MKKKSRIAIRSRGFNSSGVLANSEAGEAASANPEKVIKSCDLSGCEFMSREIKKHFAIEPCAKECSHGGWHGKHVCETLIKCIEHLVYRIKINQGGGGSKRASIA